MSKKALVLVLFALVITAASLTLPPATSKAPAMGRSTAQLESNVNCSEASDPQRVPPGCCTSNCTTNKDCDRICGKGNCVCIATSDCCRRCTY
jgi:hypothetical protein